MPIALVAPSADLSHLAFAILKLWHAYQHLQPSGTVLAIIGVAVVVVVGCIVYMDLSKTRSEGEQNETRE